MVVPLSQSDPISDLSFLTSCCVFTTDGLSSFKMMEENGVFGGEYFTFCITGCFSKGVEGADKIDEKSETKFKIEVNPFPDLVFTCLQCKPFKSTVGKGEIARNEQFLLFSQCFLSF